MSAMLHTVRATACFWNACWTGQVRASTISHRGTDQHDNGTARSVRCRPAPVPLLGRAGPGDGSIRHPPAWPCRCRVWGASKRSAGQPQSPGLPARRCPGACWASPALTPARRPAFDLATGNRKRQSSRDVRCPASSCRRGCGADPGANRSSSRRLDASACARCHGVCLFFLVLIRSSEVKEPYVSQCQPSTFPQLSFVAPAPQHLGPCPSPEL